MSATITPLGAAGTVTGSKYLLQTGEATLLVDCGIFQGPDELEQIDWQPFPVPPERIDAVLLTHAHIDHSGFLPGLVALGFHGPVFATPATIALLGLLLPDSAHIQEEQAAYANKKQYARHLPAKPLYTMQDADRALQRLQPIRYHEPTRIASGVEATLRPAGHLLGSATVQLDVQERGSNVRLGFSGDLGRYDQEVMNDPEPMPRADVLFVESTYGDRRHARTPVADTLAEAIAYVKKHKGALVIPSFAVGRAQHVLYFIRKLQDAGLAANVPIYVDSPMARDATALYCEHGAEPNLRIRLSVDDEDCPIRCRDARFVRDVQESKRLNHREGPFVVVSANGMCTAGRILHHLKNRIPDERNAVLFVGYQGVGTRGRRLLDGAGTVRIHGEPVEVRARVFRAEGMSGHADQGEILRWLRGFESPPRLALVTHGEQDASETLASLLQHRLGWRARVPRRLEPIPL